MGIDWNEMGLIIRGQVKWMYWDIGKVGFMKMMLVCIFHGFRYGMLM